VDRREYCDVCGKLLEGATFYRITLVIERGLTVGSSVVVHSRSQEVRSHESCSPKMVGEWDRLQLLARKQRRERHGY